MSKYLTYIRVQGYLQQWAEHQYGSPVKFPVASPESAALRVLLCKLPAGARPRLPGDGRMAVELPDSKEKPVASFNHITDCGEKALRDMLANLFKVQLWNDLFPLLNPESGECLTHMPLLVVIRDWCKRNGVDPDYDYTIKMKWQRLREAHPFPMKVRSSSKKFRQQEKSNK